MIAIFRILISLAVLLCAGRNAYAAQTSAFGPAFAISTAPTSGDWQRFHNLSQNDLRDLWSFHKNKKLKLQDWAWQWRLGWLRACGQPQRISWCGDILKAGLADSAVVVRAEAATQFGLAKKLSASRADVEFLVKAYRRSDNMRNGKPLFVCERILDALATLEHPEAQKAASGLARKHKRTLAYWRSRSADLTKSKSQKTNSF